MEPDPTSSEHVLEDGTKVTVRAIRPSDAEMLRAGFARLSPESRYRRFFAGVSELSDETVRYLTHVDGHDHVAVVAVVDSLDLKVEDGLGVARFIRLPDNPEVAEAAVTIMDDAQRKGLGKILLRLLVERAREVGVKRFRAEVLSDNEPMMRLLLGAGASMHTSTGNTVIFDVPIEGATSPEAGERSLVERVLHAAAESLSVFLRTLRPPPLDESAPVVAESADTRPREGDAARREDRTDEEGHT
ncbi:GNAT family N-acetyltransferase [Pendulispora albinea]|uniref:GNAT family N-acetyltransferase n=1 Tax=Pendulispora albinea TaxID=2741071 RepID=A0ABZ2LV45_9BACT